ncbi:uncharacterized protein [Nicotiana sylvestris]|uniref:uncharacterized protein n=1 Tax=Nicotiana sylvestris TaxID=4096 RepID=UPI00388C6867
MVRRNRGMLKRGSSSKPKNYDLCHKCGKPGHFIKDCPLLKREFIKYNPEKEAKRNPVPDKDFKRKRSTDNVVKQALAAWGDSSSESKNETDVGDSSMMAVENNDKVDDNSEVIFRDVQRNLKSYSPKKLMSLASVLIDAYHSLVEDKDALTLEIGEDEQTRYDLVVCVVVKETFKEREALMKRVTEIEEERYDLLGIGLQREKAPYNSQSKYVIVPDNWMITHCGNNGHFKENFQARVQSFQKNKVFAENVTTKKGPCSTHKKRILPAWTKRALIHPLAYYKGLKLAWGYILGVGKVGKLLTHSIENVYYVNGLKYNLFSVSWICDKGNKVEFLSKICTVTNLVTSEVVLVAKRYKNIYVADFESIQSGDLSCLKVVDDDVELWHRRLGHASFSLLKKLIQKDLVHGLPMSKFKVHKVCYACARGKHVKSSFKFKKDVSTSKPLDLLHIDLCGPMRVFTWTLFLRTKDETFEVFVAFEKKIQMKMESRVACIRSDHGTEFDNAKFDEFCNENGITHNFSALRTPKQNEVVERKNRTLEEMDQLGKFDAKSDEGIFLGYSSQRKAYNIYNKLTQYVEESVHVVFDESYPSCEKSAKDDQDGEPLLVPGEVIDMTNGKADMMCQVKESSGDNAASSSIKLGTSITTTETEERVIDAVQDSTST